MLIYNGVMLKNIKTTLRMRTSAMPGHASVWLAEGAIVLIPFAFVYC